MWTVVILSVLLLASAAEEQASPSLRGSRPFPAADANATLTIANGSQETGVDVSEDALPEDMLDETDSGLVDGGVNASDLAAADLAALMSVASGLSQGNASEDGVEALLLMSGGWHQGGDKMWGSGTGIESITGGNVGYYNAGMYAAHSRCGGAGCALIVNPPGHRTVQQFHIHFVHYHGYGAHLKRRLESRVCGRHGWHAGGLPCGGRAAYFPGFPGIFSKALSGGGLHHASVIAWPAACGGRGTIVELAYGCSIEHQIRGDYNPRFR